MKDLLLSRLGKIVIYAMVISILAIIICRVVLEILLRTNNFSVNEIIFTICYFIVYGSLFVFAASAITLIIMIVRKWRKRFQ